LSASYTVRRGPFEKAATFRLSDGELIQSIEGKPDKHWTLSQLRRARIAPGTNRYVPDEQVLLLHFHKRIVALGSHSFHSLGDYTDQRPAFAAFAREVCRQAAELAPQAKFQAGAARAAGVFTGAVAILGVGIVLLIVTAVGAGAAGLGIDLGARLIFVLLLMLAAQPWLVGVGPKAFDPRSIPPGLLP
jgi:hypothetical protein